MELALLGRVALLDFRAAVFKRSFRVGFGRACCSAAAVASRASAEEYDNIVGQGRFAYNVFLGNCADDRAYFKTLRNVAGVVYLRNVYFTTLFIFDYISECSV